MINPYCRQCEYFARFGNIRCRLGNNINAPYCESYEHYDWEYEREDTDESDN